MRVGRARTKRRKPEVLRDQTRALLRLEMVVGQCEGYGDDWRDSAME